MTTQLDIFDHARATQARDEAIARAESATTLWIGQARAALCRVAERQPTLLVDDIWQALDNRGVLRPSEGRAMGAVTTWGVREGLIEPTGTYRPSASVKSHRNPRAVWRSLVFGNPS